MASPVNKTRIIVSLDFPDRDQALALARLLDPHRCNVKVGKELFTSSGPELVEALVQRGFRVFLDLKFHDIPNTVAAACRAAARLGVWMLNIHAAGGRRMMEAAREAVADSARPPLLIGVTVLTSLTSDELRETGISEDTGAHVLRLARLARDSGLDGVVCSSREAQMLRRELGRNFLLVTPGIRPAGAAGDDQRRVRTPAQAIEAGSDYLVIGRPITQAPDPMKALEAIEEEIKAAATG